MVTREVLYEQRPLWVMTECNERASLQPRSIPTRLRKSVGTFTNFTVNNLELGMTVAAWCCHQTSAPLGPWADWAVGDAPGHTPQGRLGPTCWGWGSACLELLQSPGRTASPGQDSIPWAGSAGSQLTPTGWGWGLHATSSPAWLSSPCSGQRGQEGQTRAEGWFSVL